MKKIINLPVKKTAWRRRVTACFSSMLLVIVPGYLSASMCSGDGLISSVGPYADGYRFSGDTNSSSFFDLGGVDLNKTLTLLNDIDDIKGAAYDPDKGQIVLIGQGTIPVAEQIELDDLVVALRTIYSVDANGNQINPGISFDSVDITQTLIDGKMVVSYKGATQDTQFGQVLFDADYILKKLGQGVDENGVMLTSYPVPPAVAAEKCPGVTDPTLNSCLDYIGSAERFITNGVSFGGLSFQYFIEPKNIVLAMFSEGEATHQAKSFEFTEMSMQVCFRIYNADGALNTDKVCPDDTVTGAAQSQAKAFIDNISEHYDAYAEVETGGFQILKKLKRLGKIVGLVRWLRDNNVPVDLSFMAYYTPSELVTTPRLVDILQLCHDGNGNIDEASSGAYTADCGQATHNIIGGVVYGRENEASCSPWPETCPAPQLVTDALTSENRTVNPEFLDQLKWKVYSGLDFHAVSQTVSESRKDGKLAFNSFGLSRPNLGGQSIGLFPHYNSFSTKPGPLGVGWSVLPFEMSFVEPEGIYCQPGGVVFSLCNDINPATGLKAEGKIKITDNITAQSLIFELAGTIDQEDQSTNTTVSTPYFLSSETNDWIYKHPSGYFIYNKLNELGQIAKIAWFKTVTNYTHIEAVLTYIVDGYQEASGNSLAAESDAGIWSKYIYDNNSRLIAIEGNDSNNRINIDYAGEFMDRAWYSTPFGMRSVQFTATESGVSQATDSSGAALGYTYSDPENASSSLEVMGFLQSEILLSSNPDFENRTTNLVSGGLSALAQTIEYDRVLADRSADEALAGLFPGIGLSKTVKNQPGHGRSTTLYRDAHNRLTVTANKALVDGQPVQSRVHYEYDAATTANLPLSVTDARGNTTQYTYDRSGRVTSITDPRSTAQIPRVTTIERGVDGSDLTGGVYRAGREGWKVEVITDPKGRRSANKYDMAGNLIMSYRRLKETGFSKAVKLDINSDPTDEFTFIFSYAEGSAVNYLYDPASGKLASVSNTASELSGTYSWITGNDSVIVSQRNSYGQAEKVTSAGGYDTSYHYDGLARLVSVQSPTDTLATKLNYYDQGLAQDRLSTVESALGKTEQS